MKFCLYALTDIDICAKLYIYIYIYIYRERERERKLFTKFNFFSSSPLSMMIELTSTVIRQLC